MHDIIIVMKQNVLIAIPAYNEGEQIVSTIESITKRYPNIIVIDDGSVDNTVSMVEGAGVECVRHPINLGQGAAIQTGIEYGLSRLDIEYFVTFDADGQHRIEDVEKMLDHLKKNKLDIVLGSRFLGKAENISLQKKLLLKLAVKFSNLTSGVRLTDTHNGLRVFNRHAAEQMNLQMSDFSHASEIINRIREKNLKYDEYPVTIVYTDYSRRKGQSMINAINVGFDAIFHKVVGK